jgi:hypothetical protein
MIETVFRVDAKVFDVEGFLRISKWEPICYWVKGKNFQRTKKISTSSGFNLGIHYTEIFSKKTFQSHVRKISHFINEHHEELNRLKAIRGIKMCFDIGVIDGSDQMLNLSFQGEVFHQLHKNDISITISIYP